MMPGTAEGRTWRRRRRRRPRCTRHRRRQCGLGLRRHRELEPKLHDDEADNHPTDGGAGDEIHEVHQDARAHQDPVEHQRAPVPFSRGVECHEWCDDERVRPQQARQEADE